MYTISNNIKLTKEKYKNIVDSLNSEIINDLIISLKELSKYHDTTEYDFKDINDLYIIKFYDNESGNYIVAETSTSKKMVFCIDERFYTKDSEFKLSFMDNDDIDYGVCSEISMTIHDILSSYYRKIKINKILINDDEK